MSRKIGPPSNEAKLRLLAELLSHGEPIPPDLANNCSILLSNAIENSGQLKLGRRRGRPNAAEEQVERAIVLGHLMGVERISESKAKTKVAEQLGVSRRTIVEACKAWPKMVEIGRRTVDQVPKWKQRLDELRTLLHTFRNDDGTNFTGNDVAEIFDVLPSSLVSRVSTKIADSLRRDRKILSEILASEGILFDE